MPDNGDSRKTKNDNGKTKPRQTTREEQRNATSAELAYIDRLYYSGAMSVEDHANRSGELFLDDMNRLKATLPAAIQSAKSSPVPLTEMVDKALNPDPLESAPPPTASTTSPLESSTTDKSGK